MNLKVGIYDFFGYAIPGVVFSVEAFYFYHIYDSTIDTGVLLQGIDVTKFLLLLILAFLVGHIMQTFTSMIWGRLVNGAEIRQSAYDSVVQANPNLQINFKPEQVFVIQAAIKKQNPEQISEIFWYNAMRMMLSNLSLGFLLLFIFELQFCIFNQLTWQHVATSLLSGVLAVTTFFRSKLFFSLLFSTIFNTAAGFGLNLEQLIRIQPDVSSNE